MSTDNKEKEYDKTRQKESAKQTRPKSVLEAFECIVELVENSNLDKEFFEKAATHIKYASRKLKLTPMQTVLLSLFVDRSDNSRIYVSDIAKYAGCRTTKILRLSDDVDTLEQKHYLKAARSKSSVSYRIPSEVLKSLRQNKPHVNVPEQIVTLRDFFDHFDDVMEEQEDGETTHDAILKEIEAGLDNIKDTKFCLMLKRFSVGEEYRLILIHMAHRFIEYDDNHIVFGDIEDVYDNDKIPGWIKSEMRNHECVLFESNLIENVNEDGMVRADAFKLTDYAKEELLGELEIMSKGKSREGMVAADSLVEKKLIYNASEKSQVEELASILTPQRFSDVQSRLKAAGMRPGFCCLFYGSPGTGKTETVYQIARATGRDILRVDVDKIKSCWVGESEQNMKKLCDRYRNICKTSGLAPILLFNEADAILGVRMEGVTRAVDKMENSIQNIILQEMESLDGIMIATTNLTTNLDKAFERRFLYKIQFNRPTVEARSQIWQAMLPSLTGEDAHTLASQFDLSGGEIKNITANTPSMPFSPAMTASTFIR